MEDSKGMVPKRKMSKHYCRSSQYVLDGANADKRGLGHLQSKKVALAYFYRSFNLVPLVR